MTTLTANQQTRLLELQPYLARIGQNLVSTHYPGQEPDEVLAVMNAAICEQAAQDPAFLDQTPAYVVRWAAWRARDWCRREIYGRNRTPARLDRETDAGAPLAETLPAPLADLDLPLDVARALAALSAKCQAIAAMLAAGYQRKEIAARFGVTSPTLSWDLRKIKAALQGVR